MPLIKKQSYIKLIHDTGIVINIIEYIISIGMCARSFPIYPIY